MPHVFRSFNPTEGCQIKTKKEALHDLKVYCILSIGFKASYTMMCRLTRLSLQLSFVPYLYMANFSCLLWKAPSGSTAGVLSWLNKKDKLTGFCSQAPSITSYNPRLHIAWHGFKNTKTLG